MIKTRKIVLTATVLAVLFLSAMLLINKHALRSNLIRLHMVANSDSSDDQRVKLLVRDAVLGAAVLPEDITNAGEAKAVLLSQLPELESAANAVLKREGFAETASISLRPEWFPIRHYDTFSLPSGVYDSLVVRIGQAQGKNWWCVIFPSFCMAAASEDFQLCAASSGFSEGLTKTLTGQEHYEIAFFFLDCLGRLEKLFHFN